MKNTLLCTLVLGLLTGLAATLLADDAPVAKRGLMQAVTVEKGPAIDGTLSADWKKSPALTLGQCASPKPNPIEATAYVLFDPTNIYIAFDCAESDTDLLKQDTADRDGDVWQDDCVEVFVTGDLREGYYHFAVNPKGTCMDARSHDQTKDDKSWNSSAVVKASIEKGKRWIVTMAIPLKDLAGFVGDNQSWIINLNRTRPARGGQPLMEWSWAVMNSSDFHQVMDYGQIKGVNIASREDGVTRKASPPPEPPKADKAEEIGGVMVYRHFDEMNIPESKGGTEKALDLKISNSGGLKVAFLARGTNGATHAAFNLSDARSKDNTTSFSYRTVADLWTPVLYRVDRFRYNGKQSGYVANTCDFTGLRFHGNKTEGGKALLELRDFVIYRGEDTAPPEAPAGLTGKATADGIRLDWKPAKDNVGIACYAISRAGADGKFAKVGQAYTPDFVDKPAAAGDYKYRVLAADFQDNIGPWSAEAAVKVDKAYEQPKELPLLEADRAIYAENIAKIHKAGLGKVDKGKVMMFGDSITGATLWPVEAEAAVGRYKVMAHGYPSMRTDFGKGRIEAELKGENPEFCCIMYGTNNSKNPKDIPAAMEDLLAIAKSCADHGTVPIIATITPRGFTDPDSKGEAGFNEAVVKMCHENKLPIAYVFQAFQAQPDRKNLVAGDGVHLVEGGFYQAGQAWGRAMRQVSYVIIDRD